MTVRGLRRILAFFSATAASIPNEIDRVKLLNSLPRHAFGLSLALLLKELAPCALVLDPLAQLLVSARIKLSPRFATEQDQLFVVLVPLIVLLIHVGLSRPDVPLEILRFFFLTPGGGKGGGSKRKVRERKEIFTVVVVVVSSWRAFQALRLGENSVPGSSRPSFSYMNSVSQCAAYVLSRSKLGPADLKALSSHLWHRT